MNPQRAQRAAEFSPANPQGRANKGDILFSKRMSPFESQGKDEGEPSRSPDIAVLRLEALLSLRNRVPAG